MRRNLDSGDHRKNRIAGGIICLILIPPLISSACGAQGPKAAPAFVENEPPINSSPPMATPAGNQVNSNPAPDAESQSNIMTKVTDTPSSEIGGGAMPKADYPPISPDELLPEIFMAGGGGGGWNPECGDGTPNVYIEPNDGGYGGDEYYPDPDEGVLGMQFIVNGCDFRDGEQVTVTFEMPDGKSEQALTVARANEDIAEPMWQVIWWSMPGEPFGTYNVNIESGYVNLHETFGVSPPPSPMLTVSCTKYQPEGLIVLTGFRPEEQVLIAFYGGEGNRYGSELLEYGYVQVDQNGNSSFESPYNELEWVVALGQDRGVSIPSTTNDELRISAYDSFAASYNQERCYR